MAFCAPQRTGERDVMVYLHGGGWLAGTGSYVGPQLLLDRDLVLVTLNYRLGPLGKQVCFVIGTENRGLRMMTGRLS
jgi:carboxylesterase type B